MPVELTESDRALLRGERGEAVALAMRIVVEMAGVSAAERLIDVASAHVDGCLYHGVAGLEFAERMVAGGARVAVPTTLNVGALDLLHPDRYRGDPVVAANGRRQMDAYVAMGCRPTWTCAPYQLPERPAFGQHVAWAESNAVVFCNSVLGARTDRYGDFIDICAALTGRVPLAGLHRDEGRRARLVVTLEGISKRLLASDALYPVLGHLLGREAGSEVAAIVGLPADTSEDRMKALGAA
ncbi:MAG TPA: aconitase X, partial [Actinomycetota bacterium]|nr:aconitase X [Actinomycetota bacterium]